MSSSMNEKPSKSCPSLDMSVSDFGADRVDALERVLENSSGLIEIDIKLGSVGVTNDPADIASDYLDASYFAECTGSYCDQIKVAPVYLGSGGMLLRFSLSVRNVKAFVGELIRIAPWFQYEELEPAQELREAVAGFEDVLLKTKLRVPILGDNYLANFLEGSVFLENQHKFIDDFPTWSWGFFRSSASDYIGSEVYSTNNTQGVQIVVGGKQSVETLLSEHGGFSSEGSRLYEAVPFQIDQHRYILASNQLLVSIPIFQLGKAVSCWSEVIDPDVAMTHSNPWHELTSNRPEKWPTQPGTWPTPEEFQLMQKEFREQLFEFEQRIRGLWPYRYGFKWSMTATGEALVCGDEHVSFIAYTDTADRLHEGEARNVLVSAESLVETIREHAGLETGNDLDWSSFTPELFEDLCYDIILRCGRFDEGKIRKHGKTRSRDGGRDIEAWTLPRMRVVRRSGFFSAS